MNLHHIRSFCLALPGTTEDFPFDESTLAFRVGGKIYLLCDSLAFTSVNLKCDPELAVELRERYRAVKPGYHMNKTHWNTVEVPGDYAISNLEFWIRHSYDLIFASLPAKTRSEIQLSRPV